MRGDRGGGSDRHRDHSVRVVHRHRSVHGGARPVRRPHYDVFAHLVPIPVATATAPAAAAEAEQHADPKQPEP